MNGFIYFIACLISCAINVLLYYILFILFYFTAHTTTSFRTKLCVDITHNILCYRRFCIIFVRFFRQIWLPWQLPLVARSQKYHFRIADTLQHLQYSDRCTLSKPKE